MRFLYDIFPKVLHGTVSPTFSISIALFTHVSETGVETGERARFDSKKSAAFPGEDMSVGLESSAGVKTDDGSDEYDEGAAAGVPDKYSPDLFSASEYLAHFR